MYVSTHTRTAGLPDVIFANQKSRFGYILEGFEVEDVGIFMAIGTIYYPFNIFNVHLLILYSFWYFYPVLVYCAQKISGKPDAPQTVKLLIMEGMKNVPLFTGL
jgi:hypothetical protein